MFGFLRKSFRKKDLPEPSPPALPTFPDQDDWYVEDAGLPHPQWDVICKWVDDHVDNNVFEEAYTHAVRLWVARLSHAIPGSQIAVESPHFVLFSPLEKAGRKWVLNILEAARRSIFDALGSLAWKCGRGKHVVIALPPDSYARYVSHFYPDGYMLRSGGVMTSSGGYIHIAILLHTDNHFDNAIQRTLVHEFTHNALVNLPLPNWLDEALAMNFEDQLSGGEICDTFTARSFLDQFAPTELRVQGFWSGKLWYSEEDEGNQCYIFARILFRMIRQKMDGVPERFRSFVAEADWKDAGEAAALRHLGLSLGDLASQVLGPGDWKPKPSGW